MYVGPGYFFHLWFKSGWCAEQAVNRADALLFLTFQISDSASAIRCLLPRYSDLCQSCERVCFYTVEHDISTYMRIPKKKKKKRRRQKKAVCAHKYTYVHASQRLWESQNAEPEGCCASDVCIVYSVVPVHVGDCCTLMPQPSLVLLTLTAVDSRLLSRRAARPCIGREKLWGGGKDRRRPKEKIIEYTFSPYICSHTTFFSFWALLWSFILKPLPPWVTSCQTARGGCRLSSYPLFSHFSAFGIHIVLHPGNHLGTLGNWTEATQI